jgi:alanyl-tRNA synthetase
LNCATDDVVEAAERVATERDAHFKSARATLQRLAEADAALELRDSQNAGEMRVISRIFQEDAQTEYLGHFATQLAKSERTIALLARVPCGHLIFAQHPSAGKDMNVLLKQVVQQAGGKGGGTRNFARGRLDDPAQGENALAHAKKLLSGE